MATWSAGLYLRLSRDDGDRAESDSIANQREMLLQYLSQVSDMSLADIYIDDGYTGTNFDRPDFQRMMADIHAGKINCVLVKDLSRFGRDYIDVGRYLERVFPAQGVRFIAVNDKMDSMTGRYDIMLPLKNVLNGQYAQDISDKVRSSVQTKQQKGDFIGAFASYGYHKDPQNHNRLLIDPVAAQVIHRIFDLFEAGTGQERIAKLLNSENIPSPSEYKRLMGEKYHNGRRLKNTTYWTYSTIHRILQNEMYIGNMVQGKSPRQGMHGKAKKLDADRWTVVEGTHEPIIGRQQWDRVQALLKARTRDLDFDTNQSPFAGVLQCGDCLRAMVKSTSNSHIRYSCGSYKRYGPTACSKHSISHSELEQIVLADLNQIIAQVRDLKRLAEETEADATPKKQADTGALKLRIERLYTLKKAAYEDYREGLLSRGDYLRYKADYEQQESQLTAQLQQLETTTQEDILRRPWVESLIQLGQLTALDRITVAETIEKILIFDDMHMEIIYKFSDELNAIHP